MGCRCGVSGHPDTRKTGQMPTVLRFRNVSVRIYPRDHPPAHVHAVGPGWVVVINLQEMTIREVLGDTNIEEANHVLREVAKYRDVLLAAWESIHG
jgi:hypothetical protein